MSIRVWEAAARNHRGMQRAQNQDNFYLNGKWMSADAMEHGGRALAESAAPFQLYAVCDGLGGGVAGDLASLTAVMALQDWQTEWPEGVTIPELTHALRVLTDRVHALGAGGSEPAGTTLVACLWQQDRLTVLHAGDSRAYRLRAGKLTQLTTDHSEVQRLVGLGLLTPYQARLSPRRHLIHQYIGLPSWEEAFHPTVAKPLEVLPGDRFLLCSDGLHDMVEDAGIRRLLGKARDPAEAVDMLVQQALDNGGQDNVTALCLWAGGGKRRFRRKLWGPRARAGAQER